MDIFDSIDSYNKDDSSSQVVNDSLLQSEEPDIEAEYYGDFFSSIENYNDKSNKSNEISTSESELERKQRNFHNMTDANQERFIESLSEDEYKKIMQTGTVYNTHDAMYDRIASNRKSALKEATKRGEGDGEESAFWYGFDKTKSDVQNWAMLIDAKFPIGGWHHRYSKERPEGVGRFEWRSAEELYGYDNPEMPKWEDMSPDARRIRLLELFDENIARKYPNLSKEEHEKTKAEIGGTFLGVLSTPTSAFPIGKTKTGMTLIGGALGFEYGAGESLLETGQIDWKATGQYTVFGAVAAPVLVLSGRTAVKSYKKFKAKRLVAQQTKSAGELIDIYTNMVWEAVQKDVPVGDIFPKINNMLGINDDILREAVEAAGKGKIRIPNKKETEAYFEHLGYVRGDTGFKAGKFVEDLLGVTSTRVKDINPSLWHRLRKLDYNQHSRAHEAFTTVEPFLKGLNKLKKNERGVIEIALFNGDFKTVEAVLHNNEKLLDDFKATQELLNILHKEAKDAGLNLGFIENYFPRDVVDLTGLQKYLNKEQRSAIDKLLDRAKEKNGKKELTLTERGNVINKFLLSNFTTGSGTTKIRQQRKIDLITKELLQFYSTPEVSLHKYITRVINETEKVKFFGTAWHKNSLASGADVDKSIGALVEELRNVGKIGDKVEVDELSKLLRVRFIEGEMSPDKWVQNVKNISYSMVLGNPVSAMTQLGDTFLAAYKTGNLLKTVEALFTSVLPTKHLSKAPKVSLKDYGFLDIAEEFASNTKTAWWMRQSFKWSGFTTVDRIGKETILNAAFLKYSNLVSKPKKLAEFKKKWLPAFEDDLGELVTALKNKDINNEHVRLLLWHELADMQPISLSEMPVKYLQKPNGRAFYMLKTFTVKQLDVMRRDAFKLMKTPGRRTEGAKNLLRFGTYFIAGGMSSSAVKDWMMGREYDMSDEAVEQIWKLMGVNKYAMDKLIDKGDISGTVSSIVGIPTRPWLNMVEDAFKFSGGAEWVNETMTGEYKEIDPEWKSVKNVPLAGTFIYNYFLGGKEREEEREFERWNRGPSLLDSQLNRLGF